MYEYMIWLSPHEETFNLNFIIKLINMRHKLGGSKSFSLPLSLPPLSRKLIWIARIESAVSSIIYSLFFFSSIHEHTSVPPDSNVNNIQHDSIWAQNKHRANLFAISYDYPICGGNDDSNHLFDTRLWINEHDLTGKSHAWLGCNESNFGVCTAFKIAQNIKSSKKIDGVECFQQWLWHGKS